MPDFGHDIHVKYPNGHILLKTINIMERSGRVRTVGEIKRQLLTESGISNPHDYRMALRRNEHQTTVMEDALPITTYIVSQTSGGQLEFQLESLSNTRCSQYAE
ncbi:unnamed protein product [Lymnaea stagnalis]|uniref:Uncharacterized protein n=1 Tax=Lymnaea stagnalis TaxID=6523 RepID=A0AAV2I5V0_LYMST